MPKILESVRGVEERNELVIQWLGLPKHVIREMWQRYPHVRKFGMDELFQVGCLGLLRAAELWVDDGRSQFQTYAYQSIWSRILNFSLRRSKKLSPPDGVKVLPLSGVIKHGPGRTWHRRRTMEETIAERKPAPRIDPERWELVHQALRTVQPRDRDVFLCRYRDGMGLEEIGRAFGISRERVRQLSERALDRVRQQCGIATGGKAKG